MLQWHTVLTGSTWIASTHATCSTSATKILNTWRNSIATEPSQCSGHLQSIKPWIHTFWANFSGTQCWLAPPIYLSTHAICSTMPTRFLNTWENSSVVKATHSTASNKSETIWACHSGTQCWLARRRRDNRADNWSQTQREWPVGARSVGPSARSTGACSGADPRLWPVVWPVVLSYKKNV